MTVSRDILLPEEDEAIMALEPQVNPPGRVSNFFKYTGTGMSVFASACTGVADGAEMLRGMYQEGYKSVPLLAGSAISTGGISAGMAAPTTQEAFEELFLLLKHRQFPENWQSLPNDLYYEITNEVKLALLAADPSLDPMLEVKALLQAALPKINYSLYELLESILKLRDGWVGGDNNAASYDALMAFAQGEPGDARAAFYEKIAADIAILKEDYAEVKGLANVLEKIKHWEAWPKHKRLFSLLAVTPVALLAAAFDTASTYFNIQFFYHSMILKNETWPVLRKIPASAATITGGVLAAGVALTSLTTEGKETFFGVAGYFNERDEVQYYSKMSRIISPSLGYSLALLNAIVETCGDQMAVKEILSLTNVAALAGCGVAAAISNVPNVYFMGNYTIDLIDGVWRYAHQTISHHREMSKLGIAKDVLSASIALAVSSYLNEIVRSNTKVALISMADDMRIHNRASDHAANTIMWVMCAYYAVTGAAAIYSPIRSLVGGTVNKGIGFFQYAGKKCGKDTAVADVEAHQGLLQGEDVEMPKRFGCKSACTIL